jgi:hypothetical protein
VTKPKFKNAAPKPAIVWALGAIAKLAFKSTMFQRKIQLAGEISEYSNWVSNSFSEKKPPFLLRESIWKIFVKEINSSNNDWLILEFGVAWGYSTNYFLERINKQLNLNYFAFDRFTGLPRAWLGHNEGAFSANGNVPKIDDDRLNFEIGDVDSTLIFAKHIEPFQTRRRIIFFDLDLYEPSLHAWNMLKSSLKLGDFVYFDEAFDADERKLLNDYVLNDSSIKV